MTSEWDRSSPNNGILQRGKGFQLQRPGMKKDVPKTLEGGGGGGGGARISQNSMTPVTVIMNSHLLRRTLTQHPNGVQNKPGPSITA